MDSAPQKKILLVEDEPVEVKRYISGLEKYGYSVLSTGTGEQAILLADKHTDIDLILMDIELGNGIDGTEAAQIILSRHDIPVVFLSNHMEPEIVEKTEKITSYGYVIKNTGNAVLHASLKMAFKLFESKKKDKIKELALQESDRRFQTIIETSPDGIVISSLDGTIEYATNQILTLTGSDSTDEIIGKNILEFVHPDYHAKAKYLITEMLDGHFTGSAEYLLIRSDGKRIFSEVNANILQNSNNNPKGIVYVLRDISKRKQAELLLQEGLKKLQIISDFTLDSEYWISPDDRLLYQSPSIERITGYPPSLFIDNHPDFFLSIVHPDDKEDFLNFFMLSENKNARTSHIFRIITKTGETRWLENISQGVITEEGIYLGVRGSGRDITERMAAENKIMNLLSEQELILKEVHHRIKNNMTTITSLLSLQAETLTDKDARDILADTESRVLCMSMLYDKLYQSMDFSEISIAQYIPYLIQEILQNFPNHARIKVTTRIDDFVLDVKQIQPLGILINELLTNIMKYAFDGRDDGQISISVKLEGSRAILEISDNGNGMPEFVNFADAESFGLQLVGMLTKQLKGSIRIERGNGARIVMDFPRVLKADEKTLEIYSRIS